MKIGEILKDMIYGGFGAIGTRVGANAIQSLAPGIVSGTLGAYATPAIQAAVAVVPIHWIGKKFLGQKQADMLMLGGLISAGLALADAAVPNLQGRLQSYLPVYTAPQAALPVVVPTTGAGLGDVYDVDMVAAGFGDVEEVPLGIWS